VDRWWRRDPQRLELELQALAAEGLTPELDPHAEASGQIRMRLRSPLAGGVDLIAVYPDLFPFFKPEVFAPDISLPRHQNPAGGALCLLGRRTANWHVTDTLADLLRTQLPAVLGPLEPALAASGAQEEPIGEPASEYYAGDDTLLLIDGAWRLPDGARRGVFVAHCEARQPADGPVRGFVSQVLDEDGQVLCEWTGPRPAGMRHAIKGVWVRRAEVALVEPEAFARGFSPEETSYFETAVRWPKAPHTRLQAVIFPEEITQGARQDGWITLQWDVRGPGRKAAQLKGRFVRTSRAGLDDLAARMPAVRGLRSRCVVVVGLGALGSPAALELARSGVGALRLVEHDHMDPATSRRWARGWSAFGHRKTTSLAGEIARDWPWTRVETHELRIGAVQEAVETPQGEQLAAILEGADLVLDATAEVGVNHILSEMTRVRGIPYVLMNATPGAWGGMVARFNAQPGDRCWMCLRHALYTTHALPLPAADPAGLFQPAGCGEQTFTGAAFDLEPISAEAIRVIAGILAADDGYPPTPWQVGLLSLRDADGRRMAPTWRCEAVPHNEGCTCGL
jgi:hypothetical protein